MTLSLSNNPETILFQPVSKLITVLSTTPVGKYSMLLGGSLAQVSTANFEFGLTVEIIPPGNLGAPFFAGGLPELTVKAGEILVYKLPEIIDPDKEDYLLKSINLMSVIKFSQFDRPLLKFTFKPQEIDVSHDPYIVPIVLKDLNLYNPKQKTYLLKVSVVTSKPPEIKAKV